MYSPLYGCSGMPVVACMCVYTAQKLFNTENFITKSTGTRTKNINNEQKVGMLLQKRTDIYKRSRDK